MAAQGRRWCFTLNNYSEEECELSEKLDCNSIIVGKEVGECGTKHLQGFIKFKLPKRLAALKKLSDRAHWEKAKGSDLQNLEYCSKQEVTIRNGVFNSGSRGGGCASMKKALEICDKPWNELNMDEKCAYLKHEKSILRFKQLNEQSEYKSKNG